MDKIIEYIKRLIMVFFLMYGYNNLVMPINMIIPINVYTILIVYIFGLPSLLALIVIKIIFFC
jgi:hypothetical protein